VEIVGRTLLGKYKVERLLGQGGMGSVWLGHHVITERQVAVKVLDARFLANTAVVQRFGREARSASAIQHEGIVEVLDLDMTEEGVPFLVMELLDGESLAKRIERKGKLGEDETVRIAAQLLDALHAAHERGVIHRDLKPDNVFIVPGGRRGDRVKILDFGISSKVDEATAKLTVTGSVLGTPHYMSPEQASGDQDLDRRADIYAAGVLLYECVVGQVPFDAPNYNKLLRTILEGKPVPPIERGAMISRAMQDVILLAMHRDRAERPATASALRQLVVAAHHGKGSPEGRAESGEAARPASERPPAAPAPRWDLGSLEVSAPPSSGASRSRSRMSIDAPMPAVGGLEDLSPAASSTDGLEIDFGALEATRKARPSTPPSSAGTVSAPRPSSDPPARRGPASPLPPRTTPAASLEPDDQAPPPPTGIVGRWQGLSIETRRYVVGGCVAVVLFVGAVVAVRWLVRPDTVRTDAEASLRPPSVGPGSVPASREWVMIDVDGVPPGAELRLDGLPGIRLPLRIRRGTTHTLEIRAPGFASRRLEVRGEDDAHLRAEMEPIAPEPPQP
jgi:serine/threonine protein kinase